MSAELTRVGLGLVAMTAGDAGAGRGLSAALAHTEAVDDLPAMACVQTNSSAAAVSRT